MITTRTIPFLLAVCLHLTAVAQVDTCTNRISSLTNNDEDSWIMRADNGNYYVAFFSDSVSTADIWITRSVDGGITFDSAWVAINVSDSCYLPCMGQSSDGTFHLVWFQIGASVDIWYSRSVNAMNWSAPVNLTNAASVDWLPNLVVDYNDNLWVTFASQRTGNMDIFCIRSTDGGNTWSLPDTLTLHPYQDNLPFLFQALDSSFVLTWQRYNDGPYNYLSTTNEIFYKTSPDGINWSAADSITWDVTPLYTDILPGIYQNPLDSEIYFTWTTDRFSPLGYNVELSLSAIQSGATGNSASRISCNGYYGRVIPTDTAGQFIMTWVADPDYNGQHDIYLRFSDKIPLSTGISYTDQAATYSLFPNPCNSSALLHTGRTFSNATLLLYNSGGEQVRQLTGLNGQSVPVFRGDLPDGLYFVRLVQEDQIICTAPLLFGD